MSFKPGDRVGVNDPGLAQLREIMKRAIGGSEPPPNHHGTVDSYDEKFGLVYINFDESGVEGAGNQAPYPVEDVYLLGGGGGDCDT